MKKRKLADPPGPTLEPPSEMLMQLSLNAPIPRYSPSPPPRVTMKRVERPQSPVATTRKTSTPVRKISTPRRPSGKKQPLALDLSFGNGNSTTRLFRRVSDESSVVFPGPLVTNENLPPAAEALSTEAKIGRKVFSKVVDPAIQETYAQTAVKAKKEALSKVGQAWSALDALDPEGEYLLFKTLLERVQG